MGLPVEQSLDMFSCQNKNSRTNESELKTKIGEGRG